MLSVVIQRVQATWVLYLQPTLAVTRKVACLGRACTSELKGCALLSADTDFPSRHLIRLGYAALGALSVLFSFRAGVWVSFQFPLNYTGRVLT